MEEEERPSTEKGRAFTKRYKYTMTSQIIWKKNLIQLIHRLRDNGMNTAHT